MVFSYIQRILIKNPRMTISGTYFNGKITLDSLPDISKPVKVKVVFEENDNPTRLKLSDFSFAKSQELLKDVKGSFADELVRERREAE